jgi:hypothetical protein
VRYDNIKYHSSGGCVSLLGGVGWLSKPQWGEAKRRAFRPPAKGIKLMHIEGIGGVILAALGVCVLAVIVALLLPHILSSAPVLQIVEWFESLPSSPYPCSCGDLADPKG